MTAAAFLPAQATVDQDFDSSFRLLKKAENFEQTGDFKSAISTYDQCYQQLQKIREESPDYQSGQVGKEMAECFTKIDFLGPRISGPPPATAPVEQIDVVAKAPTSDELSSSNSHIKFTDVRKTFPQEYPWKTNIVTTVFWIGEHPAATSWDPNPIRHNNGPDDEYDMSGYAAASHASTLNPFYVALPFNDLTYPVLTAKWIPKGWIKPNDDPHVSICKGRWIEIKNSRGRSCFAQWEDVGPIMTDDAPYVFGAKKPVAHRGLNVSPAVAKYLGFDGAGITSWRFVDNQDVQPGMWLRYDEQALLFRAIHEQAKSPTGSSF